ncbi:glycoside hydrolase family 75 protein [Streptomyces naphthomycinicus]|uniref:glycoside hydrolase family 75 protein n=1 Tax=Streptomyces naphthomycinicus TaxID=2872625 RepID=UPI001CEC6149|nr:glycoside hydrolase family 75 protein [Streptomyces sp. TML10]
MRVPSLTLAAAGAALLAPAALPEPATAAQPTERRPVVHGEDAVTAADLLARVGRCAKLSHSRYRTDADSPATVRVCGTRDAVFWKADLDIDCDGRPSSRCNRRTDPLFTTATAFQASDGRQLNAATLPYIVVPAPSHRWNFHAHGVRGGSVAAVVYHDRVQYAVVGDTGPRDIIGEASYATARGLGVRPDPRDGGVPSGVTYIVFRDSRISHLENHAAAVKKGEWLARRFIEKNRPAPAGKPRHTLR